MARRKGGVFLPLDVNFLDDPAIVEAGEKATFLYLAMCLKCKATLADGWLTEAQIARLGVNGWRGRLKALETTGLVNHEPGVWMIASWYDHNEPAATILERRATDSARKSTRKPSGVGEDSERRGRGRGRGRDKVPPSAAATAVVVESPDGRAQRLTKTYTDVQPMSRFPAVMGVVKRAIDAGKTDAEITSALSRLAADGRSVTVETLRIEIEGQPAHHQRSTTDDRVGAGLALAARYAEEDS